MPDYRFIVTTQPQTYGGPSRYQSITTEEAQSILGVSDAAPTEPGSTTFIGLTDVPASYSGQAGKVAAVNGTEDGLEFVTISGSGETRLLG